MADIVKGLFGGSKRGGAVPDSDFADFAGAPEPAPASPPPLKKAPAPPAGAGTPLPTAAPLRPYTKWYRVWERHAPAEFLQEAIVLPLMLLLIVVHVWGRRKNRRMARNWATAHAKVLREEYAVVGFGGKPAVPSPADNEIDDVVQSKAAHALVAPEDLMREKTATSFYTYATGRQNAAFLDIRLWMYKRYNPMALGLEYLASTFFETFPPPEEKFELVTYTFDGREKDLVPVKSAAEQDALESAVKKLNSTYDSFVWAVVHKDAMRRLRDERYDLSLTVTKDVSALPAWAAVMTESAEVTEQLLTKELCELIEQAGEENFLHLVVSDQPLERPEKVVDTAPRKRIALALRFPPGSSAGTSAFDTTVPLVKWFLRFPDTLAKQAHFRPEVLRKVRVAREAELERIRRKDDEEKAEDRKADADRKKKSERDAKLKGLSAEEQRKFLDREREKGQRKQEKRMTKRG